MLRVQVRGRQDAGSVVSSGGCCWAGVVHREGADTSAVEIGLPAAAIELEARDQFIDALTGLLRTAADETSQNRGSALRALAAAAEALAAALEGEAVDDDRR